MVLLCWVHVRLSGLVPFQVIPFLQQVPQLVQGVSADQLQAQMEDPFKNKKKPKEIRRRWQSFEI